MRKQVWNYTVALAAVVVAVLLRWLADPVLGDHLPLITLFAAVAAGAWAGGLGPATFAMVAGYLVCQYLFVEPRGSLQLSTAREFLGLIAYVFTSVVVIAMGEAFRVYRARFEELQEQQGEYRHRPPSVALIRQKYSMWDSLLVFFAVCLAVLLIGGFMGYQNAHRVAENQQRVTLTRRGIAKLNSLLLSVEEAESGQRGYLLTGRPAYLEPYRRGISRVPIHLDSLLPLLPDSTQQRRLAEVADLANTKLAELAHSVALAQSGRRVEALAILASDTGRTVMVELRSAIDEMQQAEQQALTVRDAESHESFRITVLSILVSTALAMLLLAGLYLMVEYRLAERQEAAVTLADQRERLRVTLASIGDGVITTDLEGRVTSLNAVAETLTGWGEREARGQPLETVFQILDEGTRTAVLNPAARALQDGMVVRLATPTVLVGRDHREIPIDDSAAPIRNQDGRITGCVLIFRDVSERRKLEREHAERAAAAAFAAAIVESTDDAIIAVSLDGRIQTWNDAAVRLYGYTEDEAVGQPIDMLIPEDRGDEEARLVRRLLAGERISHYNTIGRRKDGSRVDVSLTISTVRDEQDRIIGTSKIVRDNTAVKAAEQQILGLMADLREADRRKDDFLAILAHELRGPLAPIRHVLEILKRREGDRVVLKDAVATMDRQLGQIVRLVDDLMDVNRINHNKLELRREPVEVGEILNQTLELARPMAEALRHQVRLTVPERPLIVSGDAVRLIQVFTNLVQNALKYTEPGGRVAVSADVEDGQVAVRVRDTGMGIPADVLPRIFDLFTQVDRTLSQSQGGLGIGLTLVRQLVTMHEGTVEARSDGPGQGSEFIVRLPRLAGVPAAAPAAQPVESKTTPRRILVVDDNRDSAESLALLLELQGHETHTAFDGEEAVEAARRLRPEVILLDIGLPRLNGLEACRRIREAPWGRGIMIIALSGWGQENDLHRAVDAGFDHHLVKPVDYPLLTRMLADLPPATQETGV